MIEVVLALGVAACALHSGARAGSASGAAEPLLTFDEAAAQRVCALYDIIIPHVTAS